MKACRTRVLDFSSALYLGLAHGSAELTDWTWLTTGAPAALRAPVGETVVGHDVAQLQGCEDGVLAPSTLHLFWDLFDILAEKSVTIYMDSGTYATARWGVERAGCRGVPVHPFRHHDADALRRALRAGARGRPILVADGFCPHCGAPAPLSDYVDAVRRRHGLLVIDDTQALGILGELPHANAPYGTGGGGSLRYSGVRGPDVLVVSSLAKAFGAPLAALAGCERLLDSFRTRSRTRVHCSPPSGVAIQAAAHALQVNRDRGNALRLNLVRLVTRFRTGVRDLGLQTSRSLFPLQTLPGLRGRAVVALHDRLRHQGVRTVLHAPHGRGARISFLISACHTTTDVDRAIEALACNS